MADSAEDIRRMNSESLVLLLQQNDLDTRGSRSVRIRRVIDNLFPEELDDTTTAASTTSTSNAMAEATAQALAPHFARMTEALDRLASATSGTPHHQTAGQHVHQAPGRDRSRSRSLPRGARHRSRSAGRSRLSSASSTRQRPHVTMHTTMPTNQSGGLYHGSQTMCSTTQPLSSELKDRIYYGEYVAKTTDL